ncbi:MAG: SWIM zinc finger family protein [Meiothermus sp.]|nr:SWIM zinc finger family protein [Meiothermus sp.]
MRLELQTLLDLAEEPILERGKELFLRGAVLEAARGRNRLQARVRGSLPFPYRVEIAFAKGEWSCTCPYPGLVCKHVAAVAFAALEAPELFASKKLGKDSPINLEALQQLSDEELYRFLQRLEAERPELLYEFAFHLLNRRERDRE